MNTRRGQRWEGGWCEDSLTVMMSAYMGTTGKWYTVNATLSRPVYLVWPCLGIRDWGNSYIFYLFPLWQQPTPRARIHWQHIIINISAKCWLIERPRPFPQDLVQKLQNCSPLKQLLQRTFIPHGSWNLECPGVEWNGSDWKGGHAKCMNW